MVELTDFFTDFPKLPELTPFHQPVSKRSNLPIS